LASSYLCVGFPACRGSATPKIAFDAPGRLSSVMNSRLSFDHLVGGREQRLRHVEAEHPRGLGVDNQLELGRLDDR